MRVGAGAGAGGGGAGAGAALVRAGSRRLHTRVAIVRLPYLFDGRPHRRRGPMLGEIILDQAETKVVAGAFGQHLAREQPSCRAHAAGQIPQPQTQTCRVEVGDSGTAQEGVELTQPAILSPVVAEVLPRIETGRDSL